MEKRSMGSDQRAKRCMVLIPTKRVHRIHQCLPADWNDGWPNVSFALSIENNQAARERLDQFLKIPCCHRSIFAAPLLEELDLTHWLETGKIELVSVAGESGLKARVCHFNWMEKIFYDCLKTKTKFTIHQTGRYFVRNGRCYTIPKKSSLVRLKEPMNGLKKKLERRISHHCLIKAYSINLSASFLIS